MKAKLSLLQRSPKSKIIKRGYINIYTQLHPQEKRFIDYETKYKRFAPNWDSTLIHALKIFRKYLKGKIRVLDVGCGHGNYLVDEERKKISWATGIDLDEKFVSKNICLDEIIIGDINNLPFGPNSFDLAVSLWVIEHLRNPSKAFSEVYRVLKPGGIFIFCTPNKNYFLVSVKTLLENLRIDKLVNMLFYGREKKDIFKTFYFANELGSLERLLRRVGFTNLKIRENFSPGYTSFDFLTFEISKILGFLAEFLNLSSFRAHIIGLVVKPKT